MTAQDVADLVLAAEAERGGGRFALCVGSGKAVESVSALLPDSGRDVFAADTDVGVMPAGRHHPFEDADVYEGLLRAYFGGRPAFDMVLLEATADGGVGRLRPGSIEALEEERWAIAIGGGGTLTLPALRGAERCLVLSQRSDVSLLLPRARRLRLPFDE
ncbi:MAG: hypothetical protein ACHQEA_00845 [Gaiellales bacterium]